jgi:glycosyltransferase involved in cell wall biosynthesis
LALALSEAGLLDALVTDLFWPRDRSWAARLAARLSPGWREMLERRSVLGLPSSQVRSSLVVGFGSLVFEKLKRLPFAIRRRVNRAADAVLGRTAGKLARRHRSGLVAYSYFGFHSIAAYDRPAMLFQVHPHPGTIRRILREELAAYPECAPSLLQEWELALPEHDFNNLVAEPRMATRLLVASSFSKQSLIEHGTPAENISVVPYGVDLERFHPDPQVDKASFTGPLRLLFVGRINQRKGVKYLLETLQLLKTQLPDQAVHLTICGRVVDDLELFRPFAEQVLIRPSVSGPDLVRAYQQAELFVFPSVAEGFGQVLLEALASGLPILSTTHTAAPDLITDGVEGFIVEPRRPDLLADRIVWAFRHREALHQMGLAARRQAELFTWPRFRQKAAQAVADYLATLN